MKTCEHLSALEAALAKRRLALAKIASPYGDDSWRWYSCACTFDAPALRKRLALPAIEYAEYDGRVAGSDATWSCKACRCVIMGMHPAYAAARTPRLA